jgi:four helix bundle protein
MSGQADGGAGTILPGAFWSVRTYVASYTAGMMPYERFEAWKVTHELALEVYRVTETWPKSERYELTSQTRRPALSAPTNIAEGAAKHGSREFRRYLDIAKGSLSELCYLLALAEIVEFLRWKDSKSWRR